MTAPGWNALLDGAPWFTGQDAYPITAYSEFMPPPRLGLKPYRHAPPGVLAVRGRRRLRLADHGV